MGSLIGLAVAASARFALDLVAPPTCAACDELLSRNAVFCARCAITVEPSSPQEDGVTASFAFGGAIAESVRRFKYGPRPDLARSMVRLVRERLPSRDDVDFVVPLAAHPQRLRARGFDPAALLAHAVADALGRPLVFALIRSRATPALAGLDAASRARAIEGAFEIAKPLRSHREARVLLVDDVRTTGATIAAARTLFEATRCEVRAHVLASTPRFDGRPYHHARSDDRKDRSTVTKAPP